MHAKSSERMGIEIEFTPETVGDLIELFKAYKKGRYHIKDDNKLIASYFLVPPFFIADHKKRVEALSKLEGKMGDYELDKIDKSLEDAWFGF